MLFGIKLLANYNSFFLWLLNWNQHSRFCMHDCALVRRAQRIPLACIVCLCEGLPSARCPERQKLMNPACVRGFAAKVPDTTNAQNKQNRRLFMVGMRAFPQCLVCGTAGFKLHLKPNCYHKSWLEQKKKKKACGFFLFPFFQYKPPTHHWDQCSMAWLVLHEKRLISISLQVAHNSRN